MTLQQQIDQLLVQQDASEFEHELVSDEVITYRSTSSPTANDTYYVRLASGIEAFHKPFSGVGVSNAMDYGHDPDQLPINECAAWRTADVIGSPVDNLVATCVMWSFEGKAGSLSLQKRGDQNVDEVFVEAPEQCSAAAFFDALIGQQDRHRGNYMWDYDSGELGLFDHGYTFALPSDYVNACEFVAWRNKQGREVLTVWEEDALNKIVQSSDLCGLETILLPDRAHALQSRAEKMLNSGTILRARQL